jgi:putative ABC transport system permease protein
MNSPSPTALPRRRGLRLSDLLRLSFGSLGANFLRSLLTILGVSIGVFSVVGVMTALSAIKSSLNTSLNVFGANVLQISKTPAVQVFGPDRSLWRRPNITPKIAYDFKILMDEQGIPTTLVAQDSGERARYLDRKTNPNKRIIGTNENYLLTNKYELSMGRNLTPADIEFNRPVTVIGEEIREELFPNEDPIGAVILLDEDRYTVVGVLKERGDLFGQSMDNLALIPIPRFVANNWHRWRSMNITIQSSSAEAMEDTESIATGLFRYVRELEPEDENDFEITSNEAIQASFAEIMLLVGAVGLGVSAIALICAGVGIMNIMLVSVTERTREIGVRKSLGARKVNILAQFLLEAVFLSEAGAAVGIFGGVIVGNVVASFLNASMILPWFWIITAVVICSLIGVGFGFLPALRAARLHPVEALRYE